MSLVKNEPVGTAAGILGIVTAAFPLLAAFKVNIDQAQQSAITGFLIVVLGFWVRSRVSPVDSAAKLKEEADRDDDDQNPPTAPTGRRLSSVAPKGGQDTTDGNVPRIVAASSLGTLAAFCFALALLFCPALMSCSASQAREAQAVQVRETARAGYAAAVIGLRLLGEAQADYMEARVNGTATAADLELAKKTMVALDDARALLAAAKPWVEKGGGGDYAKERILAALDVGLVVATELAGAGVPFKGDIVENLNAARALLGGGP